MSSADAVHVVVTMAVDENGTPYRVHVYGPYTSRHFAEKDVAEMKKDETLYYPDLPPTRYYIRKIITAPPDSVGGGKDESNREASTATGSTVSSE